MATHETIFIPKQSDAALVNCLRKLGTEHNVEAFSVKALGQASIGNVAVEGETATELNTILDLGLNLIDTASIQIRGLSVSFKRGGNDEPPSPHYDEIRITLNEQKASIDISERLKVVATLIGDLRGFDPNRTVQGLSDAQNQVIALHESTIERLETTATNLIENLGKHGEQLQTKFQDNEAKRSTEIEAHKTLLDDDHRARLEALQQREQEFEGRLAEIDDRNNTHVRRELRRELINEIQKRSEKFKLTEGTNKLRWPVHAACIFGILTLSAGAVYFATQLSTFFNTDPFETLPFVVVALKQVGLTLGAVGLGFFYIRWLNRWFDQHAKAEFELKQFQLDIDRASWLVETALEWKTSEGNAIPDALLGSLTRNLFSHGDRAPSEQLTHPADALASALLGTASNARVKVGDSILEFEGKKLKKKMATEPNLTD